MYLFTFMFNSILVSQNFQSVNFSKKQLTKTYEDL